MLPPFFYRVSSQPLIDLRSSGGRPADFGLVGLGLVLLLSLGLVALIWGIVFFIGTSPSHFI
jgi:hypothetical protein